MALYLNRERDGKRLYYADNPVSSTYDELGVYADNERMVREIIRDYFGLNKLPAGFGVYRHNPYKPRNDAAKNCKNAMEYIDWH